MRELIFSIKGLGQYKMESSKIGDYLRKESLISNNTVKILDEINPCSENENTSIELSEELLDTPKFFEIRGWLNLFTVLFSEINVNRKDNLIKIFDSVNKKKGLVFIDSMQEGGATIFPKEKPEGSQE